ncbi:MAG: hypothetical protein HN366_09890 [Deltaproteobacteria bacterium]|nr:hypothetical protein [Deltaproteobacteria bacterium]
MMEKSVVFESGDLKLEGLLDRAQGDAGVVITHPHPQYGGSMQNNVVESLVKAYCKEGLHHPPINSHIRQLKATIIF